jgi:type IV pilus modification protein PilV
MERDGMGLMHKRIADERGFTLIELLVAMTIASVGFLGLAATHATAIRATAVGRNQTVATTLAQEQLEQLRRVPYTSIANISSTNVTVGAKTYALRADVSAAPGGTAKQVTSRVDWSDQFGPHTVQLLTVISP